MKTLNNKVILVSGANRGIGKALVEAALKKGAAKVYAASRVLNKLPDFKDRRVVPIELDIRDKAQIEAASQQASDIEVLINNAGVLGPGTILEGNLVDFSYNMEVNYYGTINMMKAFVPVLKDKPEAVLLNVVSIAAYSPLPAIAAYAASKAALYSATLSLRIELAKTNINVHAANPGAIDTDMNKGSNWDMPSPEGVAEIILDKVEAGVLDIIPDEMGLGMYKAWSESPEKLAQIFHDMHHAE